MNKEFEAIVMNTYAELCIMWRVAHVTNQNQADDFDAKLKSLEAVVAAFDLTTPMEEGEVATSEPAQSSQSPTSNQPSSRNQGVPQTQPAGPPSGIMLED